MHKTLQKIEQYHCIPIIVEFDDIENIIPICDVLSDNGLPLVEITMRTESGIQAIRKVVKERPNMLVGAGTVLTKEQGITAIESGAHFLVSPGLDLDLVSLAQLNSIPITPGTCTPTEVQTALKHGVEAVKFFPASTMGEHNTLKYMVGPYPSMKFVVTGGVTLENICSYLELPNVLACGGTWMFTGTRISNPNLKEIAEKTQKTVEIIDMIRNQERKEVEV